MFFFIWHCNECVIFHGAVIKLIISFVALTAVIFTVCCQWITIFICAVNRVHFYLMLFWKCMFVLGFWCPYSCYFDWVLLMTYYFHLCCYETYCKTYAVNEYSYFHLVLLSNSLFFIRYSFVLLTELIFIWCCSENALSYCAFGALTAVTLIGCCYWITIFIYAVMTQILRLMLLMNIHTFIGCC